MKSTFLGPCLAGAVWQSALPSACMCAKASRAHWENLGTSAQRVLQLALENDQDQFVQMRARKALDLPNGQN